MGAVAERLRRPSHLADLLVPPLGVGGAGAPDPRGPGPAALLAGGLAAFCAGFVIFMVSPPWLLPHYGNAELQWAPWEQVAGDSYAIIAVTVLILSVRLPLVSRPTARVQVEVQRPRVGLRD